VDVERQVAAIGRQRRHQVQAVAEPPWRHCMRVGTHWPGHAVTLRRVADKWARLYFLFSKFFNHLNFEI
jgi:hypothetical protein